MLKIAETKVTEHWSWSRIKFAKRQDWVLSC